jgi:molybdenum-dependent DNA-binding transcriptional regulator ModE
LEQEEAMDLRSYYKKVREADAALTAKDVVLVSVETTEGGRAGVRTEVPRVIAARLIAELRARIATEDETREFHQTNRDAKETHEQEEAARRVQVMVIPSHELKKQRERS